MSSLLKTQQPFSIILQETTCTAGLFEGILEMAIDSTKIFKGGSTYMEK